MDAAPFESEPCASQDPTVESHSPDRHIPTEYEYIERETSQNETICSKGKDQTNVPTIPTNKPISISLLRSLYPTYPESELKGMKEQLDVITSINSQVRISAPYVNHVYEGNTKIINR
jgi:hypothetical protein